MTRDKLVELLRASGQYEFDEDTAADSILAALESEREGEVVLMPVHFSQIRYGEMIVGISVSNGDKRFNGKDGKIIFRPTKAKEAGL